MKIEPITPALNDKIVDRALQLGAKTEAEFNANFDKAIIEFGHSPKAYHAHAEKYFYHEDGSLDY